jgi:hypothetical protein
MSGYYSNPEVGFGSPSTGELGKGVSAWAQEKCPKRFPQGAGLASKKALSTGTRRNRSL